MSDPLPVVKIVVENQNGEFLVLKDSRKDLWELPGGKKKKGENRLEAARRELREEIGRETSNIEDLLRVELENGAHINCFVMYLQGFTGKVTLSDEHSEFRWINAGEFKDLAWHRDSEYNLPILRYIDSYRSEETDYTTGDEIDVVKVLLRNEEGDFLAVRKTSEVKVSGGEKYALYGRMAGKWELPGGRFKESSDRFKAASRELKEELGIEIGELKDVVREEIEEENTVNTWILLADDYRGEIELSKEHEEYRWVSPDEYAEMDWHQDAGYGYPPMKYLEDYLN